MGMYSLMYTVFLGLLVVGTFAVSVVLLFSNLIQLQYSSKTVAAEINKIAAERLVEACLRQGNDYINSSFLDENEKKKITDICPHIVADFAWVQDIITKKVWKFDKEGKEERVVYTSIQVENEIHPAKLWIGYEE